MTPPSIEPAVQTTGKREATKAVPSFRLRDFILAISIAHLTFIQSWHGLLFERHFSYFNSIPVNKSSLGAVLVNMAGLAAVFYFIGRAMHKANRRGLWTLANIAICAVALVPLNFARTHFWQLTAAGFDSVVRHPLVVAAGLLLVCGGLWFHRYAARIVVVAYLVLSPLALLTVSKIGWRFLAPPTTLSEHRAAPKQTITRPRGPAERRVVWMLFDELDHRTAFESRPADLSLPELTRFYTEAFRATNAFPPGGYTRYSLPALTIGREVRGARPTSASELTFNGTIRWSETESIFARARALGYTTGLIGWFHPYSRLLGDDLDYCSWYPYPAYEQERGRTFPEAMINQCCSIFSQFQQRRLHIRHFKAAEAASLKILTNSSANFTLLHLPVPHHPGIYDARRNRLTAWKYSRHREYVENLVLADQLFGRLRRAMEENGSWDKTWVILSSDHWWREANHYSGAIDHRVPFIVKAPGQNEPVGYDRRFNTLMTYQLILSVLKGELHTAAELPGWMDIFHIAPPTGYAIDGAPL